MPAGTQGGDSSPIVQLPPISNTSTVAIVGDIDITNDTKKVITKMKQNSQLIFLNGDFSYSEDEDDTRHDSTFLSINSDAVLFNHPVLCELIIFCKICLLLILPTGSLPTVTTRPSTYICGPIARKVATCGRSASGEIDKDGRLNI